MEFMENQRLGRLFSLSSRGPHGAIRSILMVNMATDINNDVEIQRSCAFKFDMFKGPMGEFLGDTCHQSQGDMW